MKPVDVNTSMDVNFSKENNQESPKFTFGSHVRISKHESIFAKAMFQIGLKKFLWLKKLKTLCRGYFGHVGKFYEKQLQITNQKEFRVVKVMKRKDNKQYVK